MGVLADYVPSAQPAIFGGGCDASGTEGATWRFPFDFTLNGVAPDLSAVTGDCAIYTAIGGTLVLELDVTGDAVGQLVVEADEADTAGLAAGEERRRRCVWYLTITDGTDVVQGWGPANSSFYILPGV